MWFWAVLVLVAAFMIGCKFGWWIASTYAVVR